MYIFKQSTTQAGTMLSDVNSNETFYYPFTDGVCKCGGRYNTIDYPYGTIIVPNKVKNINIKVFNLI